MMRLFLHIVYAFYLPRKHVRRLSSAVKVLAILIVLTFFLFVMNTDLTAA